MGINQMQVNRLTRDIRGLPPKLKSFTNQSNVMGRVARDLARDLNRAAPRDNIVSTKNRAVGSIAGSFVVQRTSGIVKRRGAEFAVRTRAFHAKFHNFGTYKQAGSFFWTRVVNRSRRNLNRNVTRYARPLFDSEFNRNVIR